LPSIAETGAIRPPSTRRLLETTELVPVGISRRHFYVKMVARARGDACERERLTSVSNTMIEGVPGILHAKVVKVQRAGKTYNPDSGISYDGQLISYTLFCW